MNRNVIVAALALCGVLGAADLARADIMYTVSGITLSTGGTLAGTFTTNDARTSVSTYDITAPASATFNGFEYTPANSSVTATTLPSQFFRIDSAGFANELELYFGAGGLTTTGGSLLSSNSYEHEPSGGNRSLGGTVTTSATTPVTTVPEPNSFMLLGGTGALVLLGGASRSRSLSRARRLGARSVAG